MFLHICTNVCRKSGAYIAATVIVGSGLLAPGALAQHLSFGVIAGGYTHNDFISRYTPIPGSQFPTVMVSNAGGYAVGASVEVGLWRRLSLEVNMLYKPLHYKDAANWSINCQGECTVIGFAPATVLTWQFPVLGKYRFSPGRVTPFLEAGPSFRQSGNRNSTDPSPVGISGGAGIEVNWRGLSFAPGVRYTRWASDHYGSDLEHLYPELGQIRTRPDQVEFLVNVTLMRFGRK